MYKPLRQDCMLGSKMFAIFYQEHHTGKAPVSRTLCTALAGRKRMGKVSPLAIITSRLL